MVPHFCTLCRHLATNTYIWESIYRPPIKEMLLQMINGNGSGKWCQKVKLCIYVVRISLIWSKPIPYL